MPVMIERCGAVVLAGGHSRRMGKNKAMLEIQGETLVSCMVRKLSVFSEVILSANDLGLAFGLPVHYVSDIYTEAGPLAGLHAALSATKKEALFCVPCDLPFFEPALINIVLDRFSPNMDALVCRDKSGRVHPLCGIYSKRIVPILEDHLQRGLRRVMSLITDLDCAILDTGDLISDRTYFNMNTPEAYRLVTAEEQGKALE